MMELNDDYGDEIPHGDVAEDAGEDGAPGDVEGTKEHFPNSFTFDGATYSRIKPPTYTPKREFASATIDASSLGVSARQASQ